MRYLVLVTFFVCFTFGCRSVGIKTVEEAQDKEVVISEPKADVVFKLAPVGDNKERELGVADLGRMGSGEIVTGSVYFENGFDKPLVLLSVNASCGCLTFDYDKSPIKTAEKRKINYKYDSKTKNGKQYSTVKINTSEGVYVLKAECDVK